MRVYHRILLALFLVVAFQSFAGTQFQATTTLTAQTSNNTSAANTFASQSNGNLGASNISKMPTRTLLYPGATGKIYVHLMPWFGFGTDHMNVGYTSNDPAQVQRQVADLVSRGIDGVIIDWFGQGTLTHKYSYYDQVVQEFRQQAESQTNFNFAVMDDAQSLKACASTAGCDITQTLIDDLTYAYNNYENSSAYLHYNNQPVVYFFGQEAYPTLDWTRVRSSVPGNPLFIFRNTGGFTYAQSNGAFSWAAPETVSTTDPMALNYLANFDQTALSRPTAYSTESGYKGFNDSLASWGTGRLIQQQCGQTWLASVAESGKFYSPSQQMLGIQVVTWNDYEEGTEMESGIDNCVSVSATVSGTVVNWTITGQANTIDHYSVYVSQDGENLMRLADETTSVNSLDLKPFQLNAGNYTVFVQAIGKPSLANKISAGAALVIPNQPPVAVLSVTPNSGAAPLTVNASSAGSFDPDGTIVSTVINFGDGSAGVNATSATHTYTSAGNYTVTVTVTDNLGASNSKSATVTANQGFSFTNSNSSATVAAGQTASYNLSLDTKGSGFTGTVSVVCSGAPAGTTCSASPASANLNSGNVSVPITITVVTSSQARMNPAPLKGFPVLFATVFAGLFCGANKRARRVILAALATLLLLAMISCGGGAGTTTTQSASPRSPTNATLTITGTSPGQTATATLSLTITH